MLDAGYVLTVQIWEFSVASSLRVARRNVHDAQIEELGLTVFSETKRNE